MRGLVRLLAAAAPLLAGLSAPVQGAEFADTLGTDDPVVAFNLAGVSDWGTQLPFLDIARTMRPFFAATPEIWEAVSHADLVAGGYLDAQGWPMRVPPGADRIRTGWDRGAPFAQDGISGRYVLTYAGNAQLALGGGARVVAQTSGSITFDIDGQGFWLDISRIDPDGTGDYLRDLSIVRADQLALWRAGAIFNPQWLGVIEDARELRFMDWMLTNNSAVSGWADRPKVEDATWAEKGVPVEVMLRLANEIGAEPWFTVPHLADDDYARALAEAIRDGLDRRLRARVEYSNETWNWSFAQTQWLAEQADRSWGTGDPNSYYVKRATEIARIFEGVFADAPDRLVNVLGGQAVNTWLTGILLEAPLWRAKEPAQYVPPARVFEELALTTYFGGSEVSDPASRKVFLDKAAKGQAALAEWMTARLLDPATEGSVPATLRVLGQQRAIANRHGLRLTAYEGGQHAHHLAFVEGLGPTEVDIVERFLTHYVRGDEMGDLYRRLWDGWAGVGQGPFMHYVDVQAPGKWGSWGLLANLDDRTPRAAVVLDRARRGGNWWGGSAGPQFRQGRIVMATGAGGQLSGTVEEDYLVGGAGDDRLVPGPGNDGLNGGDGKDVVVLAGAAGDYHVARRGEGFTLDGPDGRKIAVGVELVEFSAGGTIPLIDLAR